MRKTIWRQPVAWIVAATMLAGCAGMNRGCASIGASNFGADWVVVQYDMNGQPFNCWKLQGIAIANETGSDGIYWASQGAGHLVHLSGWYNRVQVSSKDYVAAGALIGVDALQCGSGRYPVKNATP